MILRNWNLLKMVCSIICVISFASCEQSYSPPATQGNYNYMVVDGLINTGTDSTIFNLSNSSNLGDSLPAAPVTGAEIIVEGSQGYSSQLTELGNGRYGSAALNVDPTQQYRVSISTPNGDRYLSDYVPVTQAPAIDSISWKQQNQEVQIFVTTHDPQNLVNYYEWKFAETWEYQAAYDAETIYVNGAILPRPDSQQVYTCWSSSNSTDILVGSSSNLSQHIIYEQPLTSILQPSVKLSVEYSILVKQFGLTNAAYSYWEDLKANTEELGNIFAPTPSEVSGNIHCINNPALPVLGYVSAGNVQEKRIFINNQQLNDWGYSTGCSDTTVSIDSYINKYYYRGFEPIDFVGVCCVSMTGNNCADCTLAGGTTMQPSFWPP